MNYLKKIIPFCLIVFIVGCSEIGNNINMTPPAAEPSSSPETEREIGSFFTKILDTDKERVNNLIVCANALNGVLLEPGEVFSFNDTVGRRTEEKGYEEARILIGDEAGCAVGGGVCQISSTLYNAAKNAGMEIIERHNHQNEVHYVALGDDAAVSYGTLDFKFKNISQSSARLALSVENGYVYAKIYLVS